MPHHDEACDADAYSLCDVSSLPLLRFISRLGLARGDIADRYLSLGSLPQLWRTGPLESCIRMPRATSHSRRATRRRGVSTSAALPLPPPVNRQEPVPRKCRAISPTGKVSPTHVNKTTSTIFSQAAASFSAGSPREYLADVIIRIYELTNKLKAPLSSIVFIASRSGFKESGG